MDPIALWAMTNLELELLSARVHRLRRLCAERGIDLAGRHHTDAVVESIDLAGALGSPIPSLAASLEVALDSLGILGEPVIGGVPRAVLEWFFGRRRGH